MGAISNKITTLATEDNAKSYELADDKKQFLIDALEISPSHANLDYFLNKLSNAFNTINGKSDENSDEGMKGSANARYMLRQCKSSGACWAETEVNWDRKFGKCDRRTMRKHNTVYTRSALRQWGKRNGLTIEAADLQKMPVAI